MKARDYAGTVYLLHLERPLAGAQNQHGRPSAAHYLGYTVSRDPKRRVKLHAKGQSGSKYMRQAHLEGIAFKLVRVWTDADRHQERKLKLQKKSRALCPECKAAA